MLHFGAEKRLIGQTPTYKAASDQGLFFLVIISTTAVKWFRIKVSDELNYNRYAE